MLAAAQATASGPKPGWYEGEEHQIEREHVDEQVGRGEAVAFHEQHAVHHPPRGLPPPGPLLRRRPSGRLRPPVGGTCGGGDPAGPASPTVLLGDRPSTGPGYEGMPGGQPVM